MFSLFSTILLVSEAELAGNNGTLPDRRCGHTKDQPDGRPCQQRKVDFGLKAMKCASDIWQGILVSQSGTLTRRIDRAVCSGLLKELTGFSSDN